MKKKIGITGVLWLWVITLIAQTNSLSTLQYWWDDDLPAGVQKTISGSPATLNETADAATLFDGLHRLNYRVKDSRGAWSQTVTSYFLKRTNQPTGGNALATLQYWWDDNLANSVQKTVSGTGIVQLNETGDVSALLDGLHRLNYRIKDSRGAWSQTVTSYFLKRTNQPTGGNALATLQYWWDDNLANSVQKTVSGNGMVQLNETGDVSALLDGLHRLNYRIKDSRGVWSQTVTTYFLKRTNVPTEENGIIGYEYWFKDDTKKTFKSIEKTMTANIIDAVDIVSQRKGKQIFHFCVVDANGQRSATTADTIDINYRLEIHNQEDLNRYAGYEFIGSDVVISGSAVTSLSGLQWKSVGGNLIIDNTSLTNLAGLDSLKAIEGNLSIVYSRSLKIFNYLIYSKITLKIVVYNLHFLYLCSENTV